VQRQQQVDRADLVMVRNRAFHLVVRLGGFKKAAARDPRGNVDLRKWGLEALIFTAESDMRCALNNLQMTSAGFDKQLQKRTFKVYD
jgi:hypothetical protein